jgi:riboflavin-specific deaminase-like protein
MMACDAAAADERAAWEALLARRRGGMAEGPPGGLEAAAPPPLDLYAALVEAAHGRSFALAHLAQSLDGRIATANGVSQWLTGDADIVHTHRLRALADAVLVGAATVQHDDPQLTVRRCTGPQPVRVVVDAERRLGSAYRVFQDRAAPTLVLAAEDRVRPGERQLGQAEIVGLPRGGDGHLDPWTIRRALAERGLPWLFVEGGGVTISRFLFAGALDRLQLMVAPVLLGSGRPSLSLPEIADLSRSIRPRIRRAALGEDMLFECIFHD